MKPIKKPSVQIRRKFDPTFKREAVQNWLSSGKSAELIGKELGLLPAGAKPGSWADLQGQLEAAQREIRHLREQRDILKKTLGILSEPSTNAM